MNSFSLLWRTWSVILALALQMAAAFAQGIVQWVKVDGTSQYDTMIGAALGSAGEIYLAGRFGHAGLHNPMEAVLFKYDSNGLQTAAQSWHGEGINAVAVEPLGGYYLTGTVKDSVLLGVGRVEDFYLAKYASNGSLLWEYTAGTLNDFDRTRLTDGQSGYLIALDAEGNTYVAGESIGPAVYGNKRFPNTVGGPLLCKFAPDGTLLWVRRAEGQMRVAYGSVLPGGAANAIALDPVGNVIISGPMTKGAANFDGTIVNILSAYDYGSFVAKYSPAGEVLWAKAVSGIVAADNQGNVVINGLISNGQAILDGAAITIDDPSHYNSFVAKYNPAGVLLWAKAAPVGGLFADRQRNIYSGPSKLDPSGNLIWERTTVGANLTVVTLNGRDEPVFRGTITGTVNLDGHVVQGDTDEYDDFVVCKADVKGNFQWAVSATSGNSEPGLSKGPFGYGIGPVLCDHFGNVVVLGSVHCPWSFSQQTYACGVVGKFGEFPVSVQVGGNDDIFLARISDPPPAELSTARTATGLVLSWPLEAMNLVLEAATSLPAVSWTMVTNTPTVTAAIRSVELPLTGPARFFRLRKP